MEIAVKERPQFLWLQFTFAMSSVYHGSNMTSEDTTGEDEYWEQIFPCHLGAFDVHFYCDYKNAFMDQ